MWKVVLTCSLDLFAANGVGVWVDFVVSSKVLSRNEACQGKIELTDSCQIVSKRQQRRADHLSL